MVVDTYLVEVFHLTDPHDDTSAMDGETDLKTRVTPKSCAGLTTEQLLNLKGVIECPEPDRDILRFDARLRLFPPFTNNDFSPLSIKNTLLQSCYLRNTKWACGVAVYTGNETKLGMSKGIAEPKLTAADAMLDRLTTAIFIFQIVVVLILGVAKMPSSEMPLHEKENQCSVQPNFKVKVVPIVLHALNEQLVKKSKSKGAPFENA